MSPAASPISAVQPPLAAPPCAWLLRPTSGGLVCAAHPVGASPWFRPRDCDLPVASLCRVCSRAVVPIRSRFSWSFACLTCRRVDAALAAPYRASSMIPLEGSAEANRGTVYERLHPALADRTRRTESVVDRRLRVNITADVPASNAGLELLGTFQRGVLGTMSAVSGLTAILLDPAAVGPVLSTIGHPMDPVRPGPYVRWAEWQSEFPASIAASARAYQLVVRRVHPWIDSVEPRVADLDWLSALAIASRKDGRRPTNDDGRTPR
ncbi:MAG: hypothetical protein ACOH2F_04650 [Cellulomonas sp.]